MPRISMVGAQSARGELQDLYTEIQTAMGTPDVPAVFRVMSQSPALLAATWQLFKTLMLTDSQLPRATKELIAVVVSQANECRYCVTAHSIFLKALGYSDDQIERATERAESALVDPATRALLDFAEQVTLASQDIRDAQVRMLIALGFSEAQVLEATAIAAFFCGINRLVNALNIQPNLLMEVGIHLPPPLLRQVVQVAESSSNNQMNHRDATAHHDG